MIIHTIPDGPPNINKGVSGVKYYASLTSLGCKEYCIQQ